MGIGEVRMFSYFGSGPSAEEQEKQITDEAKKLLLQDTPNENVTDNTWEKEYKEYLEGMKTVVRQRKTLVGWGVQTTLVGESQDLIINRKTEKTIRDLYNAEKAKKAPVVNNNSTSVQIVKDSKAEALELLNQGLEEPVEITPWREEYLSKMQKVINERNALQETFRATTGWIDWAKSFVSDPLEIQENKQKEAKIRLEYQQKIRAHRMIKAIPHHEILEPTVLDGYFKALVKLEKNLDVLAEKNAKKTYIQQMTSDQSEETKLVREKEDLKEKIKASILEKKRYEIQEKLKEKLQAYDLLDNIPRDLRKHLVLALGDALIRQKDDPALKNPGVRHAGRKIRLAIELSKIPNFHTYTFETQVKIIEKAADVMRKLAKIELQKQKIHETQSINRSSNEKAKLIQLQQAEDKCAADLEHIVYQVSSNRLDLDSEFEKEINEKINKKQKNNKTNTGFVLSPGFKAAVEAADFLFRTQSKTLITNILNAVQQPEVEENVYRHQRVNIKDILMFIPREIDDILTKPKSYIDRLFRGTALAGSAVGMGIATAVLLGLLGNPFTGAATIGLIVGITLTVAVVAGTAKLAKWISRKTAEKIYGISDPDRYTLSQQAISFFGKDNAKEIRKFFVAEIRGIHQEIERLDEIQSPPERKTRSKILADKLFKIETAWNAIQDANENAHPREKWREYLQLVYPEIKVERQEKLASEVRNKIIDITHVLLGATKPEEKPRVGEPQQTRTPALTHSYGSAASAAFSSLLHKKPKKQDESEILYSSRSKSSTLQKKLDLLEQVDKRIKAGKKHDD